MAHKIVENLRNRVPYIRRLHRRIDELRCQLANAAAAPELHPLCDSQNAEVMEQFREFLRLLRPHEVCGGAKRRFGRDADGGYVMLDDLHSARSVLSLGVGTEISWDTAMADRGLRVLQFDHTIDAPPAPNSRFEFNRLRVVGQPQSPEDIALSDIVGAPDLRPDDHLIAKIDIEGAEWEVLARSDAATLARFGQMAIEFHDVRNFVEPTWRATALLALRNLMKSHACIHVHGNNCGPFTVVGGFAFPNNFEASFVRRRDYELVPSDASFPTGLDRPCNPKVPDFYLGRWSY
jgi:hypothetical protein